MINMIKALDPYLRRKAVKEPMPTSLDDAIARTLEAFRTADSPASFMPQVTQQVAMQAMAPPPQPQQPQQMDLDAVRHTPNRQWSLHALSGARQQNVFSGRPLGQSFGYGPSAQPHSEGLHAVQSERPPRSGYPSERPDRERDSRGRAAEMTGVSPAERKGVSNAETTAETRGTGARHAGPFVGAGRLPTPPVFPCIPGTRIRGSRTTTMGRNQPIVVPRRGAGSRTMGDLPVRRTSHAKAALGLEVVVSTVVR